jgi:hypothetical protein
VNLRTAAIATIVLATALVYAFRPMCVALSVTDVAAFTTPIEARTDRDFYLRVFQQVDGQWYQCRTWISRQLFF